MNRSGQSFIPSDFCDKVAKQLGSYNMTTGANKEFLVTFYFDHRFVKVFPKKEQVMFEGKKITAHPMEFHARLQYPFAVFAFKAARAIDGSPIPSNIAWTPDNKDKIFELRVRALLDADKVAGWAHRTNSHIFPTTFAAFIEPLAHCQLSMPITRMFRSIYNGDCLNDQERLIPHRTRPEGHAYKMDDRDQWEFLEFFYHGFQRPADYLVHFLTEFVCQFTWCLRLFTLTDKLKDEFEELKSKYSVHLWKMLPEMLPEMLDPPCYWEHLQSVDEHHFPGMHDQNTPFSHIFHLLTNGLDLDLSKHSILRHHREKVEQYLKSKPNKSNPPFDKKGYTRFSMAVREAVYTEILPMIAIRGMNPKMECSVSKETLSAMSEYVFYHIIFLGCHLFLTLIFQIQAYFRH